MWPAKKIKNDGKYEWTDHSKFKMQFYGLSPQRVTRVIKSPLRVENGIVENTVAVMQPVSTKRGEDGKKTWSQEIWVMYQVKTQNAKRKTRNVMNQKQNKNDKLVELRQQISGSLNKKIVIISAWRYPGKTEEGEGLPAEILQEIESALN